MKLIDNLNVKIFADGAEKSGMLNMAEKKYIKGFTTNPTLMKKAGIENYKEFALDILSYIKEKPISFEVFSDDFSEMILQAKEISTWGNNVNVKIPITNTKGETSVEVVRELSAQGIKINVTAMMTLEQIKEVTKPLADGAGGYVSVFAGRIADTGVDPLPHMVEILDYLKEYPSVELIWASPRELLNVIQADEIGCHIITVTNDILKKLNLLGKNLTEYSLDTVKMFFNDAQSVGYTIK